jgi:hypothetical protein
VCTGPQTPLIAAPVAQLVRGLPAMVIQSLFIGQRGVSRVAVLSLVLSCLAAVNNLWRGVLELCLLGGSGKELPEDEDGDGDEGSDAAEGSVFRELRDAASVGSRGM